jgi:hypothetical protein
MALLNFRGAPHGGRNRFLPEWQDQPRITPTTIIDHSIVGSAEGAWQMFKDRSSLESHFIVDLNGEIWQLMDTSRQADANLKANRYALSIETADRGNPDIQPWTPEQLDSLEWLHNELVRLHPGIPRRKSRSCDDPSGLGYHTLHGAPSCWTPVAKSCPGVIRKKQWDALLLPAFLRGPDNEQEWSDVATQAEIRAAVQAELAEAFGKRWDSTAYTLTELLGKFRGPDKALYKVLDRLDTNLQAVAARVAAIESDVDILIEQATEPEPEPPA